MKLLRCARISLALCSAALILLLSGCASYQQSRSLLQNTPEDLPRTVQLSNTPFVAQDDYYCGPSALSMMLQAQSIDVPLDALTSMVYVPERKGSFQIELKAAARRFDLLPYELDPKIEDVFRELAAGNPVLILQNLGLSSYPTWHYAVVVGYDLDEKEVILHSGLEAFKRIAIGTFERTWLNGKDWGIVMLPPDNIPFTATSLKYQFVIEDLVSIGKSSTALDAYLSALNEWPDEARLHFGAANLLYQLNEYEDATKHYINALSIDPNKAEYWNNLAYSRAQLACTDALAAASCAKILSPNKVQFESTKDEVKQLLKKVSQDSATTQCAPLPTCPN